MTVETKQVHQLVGGELAKFVRKVEAGDLGFLTALNDERGRELDLAEDFLSGRPLALVFVKSLEQAAAKAELRKFADAADRLEATGANLVIIPAEVDAAKHRSAKRRLGLPFLVLADPGGIMFAAYGLNRADLPGKVAVRTVLLNPLRQIAGLWDRPGAGDHAAKVLEMVKQTKSASNELAPPHAPVLVIPGVLEARECQDLIRLFEREGEIKVARGQARAEGKDYKFPVYDKDRQDRIDHVIKNPQVLGFLDQRLKARVYPLIKKAFGFEVTRHEDLHIARYAGRREGTDVGHRDNTHASTAYRRFALSISLNDDYQGGELVFREFSDKGYRGKPGTALVFSSALLHEILETRKGVRYNLISHFFNDAAAPPGAPRVGGY